MGWIRVLAFREQVSWWENNGQRDKRQYREDGPSSQLPPLDHAPVPQSREEARKDAAPAPQVKGEAPQTKSRAIAPEEQDNMARGDEGGQSFPGTGWGERREDRVRRVQFTPEPVALDRIIFRYEYASGLRALGIDFSRHGWHDRLADREDERGFAKAPRR
jgi:hypothetical protein